MWVEFQTKLRPFRVFSVQDVKKMSCRFNHQITRGDDGVLLVKGYTIHACIDRDWKMTRFPDYFYETLTRISVD